ncbi:MAG TPA: anti-sigma factor [Acidimicrobiales bacterium]|nr:anti-sigma factor [Acidimicrobiales bacterium]
MGRELSHAEVADLLGAYALDALEPAELQAVDRHVQGCQACLAEVSEHREVAGLLTPGWGKPPPGLWDKIAASLEEQPPPLDLAPVIAMKPAPPPPPTVASGADRAARRGFGVGIAAMVAVAAMAMIGFLGVRAIDDGGLRDPDVTALAELERSANAALADPSAQKVDLVSTDGARYVQAIVLRDGTGYLVNPRLPTLPAERTYQLWAVVGTNKISVGVLGNELGIVPFKMNGNVSALAITEEVAGGVVASRADPVVVGKVQAA